MSTGTAVTTKELKPIDEIRSNITKLEPQFKMALPPHIKPEKFMRVVLTAIGQNKDIATADRTSLYAAALKAAQDGLLPDNREGAFVMFGREVTWMPMVGGILKKVRNSGELASITSQVVYQNDQFEYWIDNDGEHILHKPLMSGDRGQAVKVYALAKTKDEAVYIEVMDEAQVNAVRGIARTKNVWDGPFKHEMWRKSAIRRLSKRLPMSTDLDEFMRRDDSLYDVDTPSPAPSVSEGEPSRLKNIITQKQEPQVITPLDEEREPGQDG